MSMASRSHQFFVAGSITLVLVGLSAYATHVTLVAAVPVKQLSGYLSMMFGWLLDFTGLGGRSALVAVILGLCILSLAAALAGCWVLVKAFDFAPARQVAWMLLLAGVFTASTILVPALPATRAFSEAIGPAEPIGYTMLVVLIAVCFARFFAIFPRSVDTDSVHATFFGWRLMRMLLRDHGKRSLFLRPWHAGLVSGRAVWLLPLATVVAGIGIVLLGLVFPRTIINPLLLVGLLTAAGFYLFVALPYAAASMFHLYHFGTLAERRRAALLRSAMISVFVLAATLFFAFPLLVVSKFFLSEMLQVALALVCILGLVMLPVVAIVMVTISVLQDGALDPRVAFRRFTFWTVLGLVLTLAFVFLERLAALKVVQWFQLAPDTGAVVAGALIAFSFIPLRSGVQKIVERLADRWIPVQLVADGHRALKAVAITDLSGYTALSARDEPAALLQSAVLKRVASNAVAQQDGRLVKSLGDAMMLVFHSPEAAVRAVRAIHAEFPRAALAVADAPLLLHTAVHCGEVVTLNDGDIFGQTVNVTARLVDAAAAGQIVVSSAVAAAVPALDVKSLGERKFKNVPMPIQCLLVAK